MYKALFVPLQLSLVTIGCLGASPILAQITSDGTVNTQVNTNGNIAEITGGETRGGNLFHSFQDFSVPMGNEAFFNNAAEISNILSRVTGGNISNIDGLIRANGSASLFLINPAGIIFGENARLDIGGSFYSSTASSILFEDGEFSAVDNLQQPILTINAPIGLSFRDEPGDIINRSFAQNDARELVGLEVDTGKNLALVGGDINFEAGEATAKGGNIYLGGLAEAGIVTLNEDGSLSFPIDLTLANITLTNAADVDVRGTGGGSIAIDAQNLSLAAGEFGTSVIRGGISSNSTNTEAQAGNITVNVAENITLNDSRILNGVASGGIGNAGNIAITTSSLELTNGGDIDASTLGQGNAGAVTVTATGDLTADGENSAGFPSGVASQVASGAEGDAGGITISTANLNLTAGGRVGADTLGQGNAGAVNVTVTGDITADGENSEGFPSGISSGVDTGAEGDAGGITISTTNLNLTAGGRVDASTLGQGNAAAVNITATGDLTADGENSEGFSSGITSLVDTGAEGDSGGIIISTTNLNLTAGGLVIASTFGQGNAGAVDVTAEGDLTADGENSEGIPSGVASQVASGAVGNSGRVTISTANLNLTNGGLVAADTFGQGNANNVTIDASESIFIDGAIARFRSGISAGAQIGDGDGGNVVVSTGNLTIANGGTIEATNFDNIGDDDTPGTGRPGTITIVANSINLTDNARIEAATQFTGEASGIINLNIAEDLTLENNSFISAQAFGDADGGNLSIDARFIVAFPDNGTGNDLLATAEQGTGGNINLNVEQLFGLQPRQAIDAEGNFLSNNTNDIDVSGSIAGEININITNVDPLRGTTELPTNVVEPEQTTAQACQTDRLSGISSGLTIEGKGGIPPEPGLPLDSHNIFVSGQTNPQSTIPAPIETAQGKIQPARGVKVTESGEIILTAYRTNNSGDRLTETRKC